MKEFVYICPYCGSSDLVWDAATRWDIATQKSYLSSEYDNCDCLDCETSDISPEDKELFFQIVAVYNDKDCVAISPRYDSSHKARKAAKVTIDQYKKLHALNDNPEELKYVMSAYYMDDDDLVVWVEDFLLMEKNYTANFL